MFVLKGHVVRVSSKTQYALRTVIDLAMHFGGDVCRVADIAERQQIPGKFLQQILLTLKAAGFVSSKRGVRGGYCLAVDPTELAMADIVSLTDEGLLTGPAPLEGSSLAARSSDRALEEAWREIGDHVADRLSATTIAHLIVRSKELGRDGVTNYVI